MMQILPKYSVLTLILHAFYGSSQHQPKNGLFFVASESASRTLLRPYWTSKSAVRRPITTIRGKLSPSFVSRDVSYNGEDDVHVPKDDLCVRCLLSTRGGGAQQKMKKCMKYTKIGLVNLSAKDADMEGDNDGGGDDSCSKITSEDTGNGDKMVGFVVDDWIQKQYQTNVVGEEGDIAAVGMGNIVTFPPKKITNLESSSTGTECDEYEFSQGSFLETNRSDGKKNDIGNVVETIGALADAIILLYNTSNPLRHKAMVRLIKGIERQRETSNNERDIDVVILAEGEKALRELTAILDVLRADDLGESIQIIPVSRDQDSLQSQYGPSVYHAVEKALEINSNRDSEVPMSVFPRLVGRVYSRLCGKGSDSTVDFDTIRIKRDRSQIDRDLLGSEPEVESTSARFDLEDEYDITKDEETKDNSGLPTPQAEDLKNAEEGSIKEEYSLGINSINGKKHDPLPESGPSKALTKAVNQKVEEVLAHSQKLLTKLEMKQDEVLLDFESKMPILEFGRDANNILKEAKMAFDEYKIRKHVIGPADAEFVDLNCRQVLIQVNVNVYRLFENQLQSLREYYGRRYEKIIEQLQIEDGSSIDLDQESLKEKRIKRDEILAEEAKRATEGFRTAAANAVPFILRHGELKEFSVGYRYEAALDGLIRDMMHATSSLQSLEEEWERVNVESDDDNEENLPTMGGRGPVKWYEKLGARVLVFAVNYLQGWLAYQGIRKAAAERDRMMPKFPLF